MFLQTIQRVHPYKTTIDSITGNGKGKWFFLGLAGVLPQVVNRYKLKAEQMKPRQCLSLITAVL